MMYKIDQKLGQGAFGVVYHLQISNGDEFALKVAEIGRLKSHEIDAVSEARLMLKLTHAHLVQCCASFNHGSYIYLVMELCRHGTLKSFLNARTKLVRESQVLDWLGQMADALRYLHVSRVIHRDLKTDNIFLDDRRHVKIGDLGISRELDYTAQRAGTFIGTFCYMSPEILKSSTYSYETDIWSLGCCVHEIMTLHQTFAAQSMMKIMENIMDAKIPPMPDIYSKSLQKLVLLMLDRTAQKRPDGLEIIFTVSKIQGFPFESGPYTILKDVKLNQKLLCKAVQDFEHIFSEDIIPHRDQPTVQSREEKTVQRETDKYIDSVNLLEDKCLKTENQPRPLPHCRYITKDIQDNPEIGRIKHHKAHKHKKHNKLPFSIIFPGHSDQKQHKPQVEHCSDYNLQHISSPLSHPSSASNNIFVSPTLSSSSDSTSSNTDTTSKAWILPTAESIKFSNSGDADMSINSYMNHLAADSKKWLRLKFGLSEDRNLKSQVSDGEYESDSLVTLYTRAQVVRYKNRK